MLHVRKEEPLWLNKYVVVNAYFSKSTFCEWCHCHEFYVESHFRDNAYLSYLTNGKPSSEKKHPRLYDGKIDMEHLEKDCFEIIPLEGR